MTGGCLCLYDVEVRWNHRSILTVKDMQVREGEFVGIIGTNGAGKSTLLKVCCGLIKPNQGMVELNGRNLAGLSAWSKANFRKRIGYIIKWIRSHKLISFYRIHVIFTEFYIHSCGFIALAENIVVFNLLYKYFRVKSCNLFFNKRF